MSRRDHVVRTDDQGGMGTSRSLGGCQIFCARADAGDARQTEVTPITPITVSSTRDYERCYVAATIDQLSVTLGFKVTFTGSSTAERQGLWEGAGDLGYSSLTMVGVSIDMDFHPADAAYVRLTAENDSTGGTFTAWGEGIYTRTPPDSIPPRNEVRNLHGPVALDQTQFGPYGGLRDPSDPYYQPIDYWVGYPLLDLMAGPVVFPVDAWTTFGASIWPDRCWIPGYSCDDPAVTWSGVVTFQFAELGDDVVVEMT